MENGEIVKGYKIINHIEQGGAGIVYDVQKGSAHYALKECAGLDEGSLKRFARELRIAKTLNSPNIVKVIDEDIQADSPYYIMKMCEESLKQAVDRELDLCPSS
jgi:serine/threonine protein kinase